MVGGAESLPFPSHIPLPARLAMEVEAKELQLSAANSEAQQKEQLLQDATTEVQRLKKMLDTKSQKILTIQQVHLGTRLGPGGCSHSWVGAARCS